MKKIIPFIFFLFVIALLIRLCRFLSNLIRLKQKVHKFGRKICTLPDGYEAKKKSYTTALISYIIVILCTLVLVFLTKAILVFVLILFSGVNILGLVLFRKTLQYNGIYENGIIQGTFIKWNKIAFWKKADATTLVVHLKNGESINLHVTENTQEVITLFLGKINLKDQRFP